MSDVAVLKLFADLGDVLVEVVGVSKAYESGGVFAVIGQAAGMLAKGQLLLTDIKAAVPELSSLSLDEDKEVVLAALACFQKVLAAV